MATCPNQHPVDDGEEYCGECGSRVEGVVVETPPTPGSDTWTCDAAHCGTTQGMSRFCEACGQPNRTHPDYVEEDDPAVEEPATVPNADAAAASWRLDASADRDYFARMSVGGGPDAGGLVFPAVYPPRRFPIDREQVFIGRRSRSRGIEPDVDLSAAPEDPGVSHAHAAIVLQDGRLSIVDVGSANGTYLNGSTEPIPANTPMPLHQGDSIHLGAWTRFIVRHD